jgi:hypothetical protein
LIIESALNVCRWTCDSPCICIFTSFERSSLAQIHICAYFISFICIQGADQSLSGNYTCSAKNLFGDDNITYTLMVLMPPSAPSLEVQFTTARSIRLHWTQPEDGGSITQGLFMVNLNKPSSAIL